MTAREYLHHHLGPSRLGALMVCPASYVISRHETELDPDRNAIFRLCHESAMPHASMDPSLGDYHVDLVRKARAWSAPLRPPRAIHAEYRLPPLNLGEGEFYRPFGTIDLGYEFDDTEGIEWAIYEYKFGPNAPDEETFSAQMGGYAAMVLEGFGATEVHCAVLHVPTGTEWARSYSQADLPGLKDWYRGIINNCLAEHPILAPGRQCVWCPGRAKCPAMKFEMEVIANVYTKDLVMTPRDRGELLDKARRVKAMAELVEMQARKLLSEDPASIEGWSLAKYRSRRLRDPRRVFGRLTRKARIGAREVWPCFTVSKTKAQKLLGDAYKLILEDLEVEDEDETERLVRTNE